MQAGGLAVKVLLWPHQRCCISGHVLPGGPRTVHSTRFASFSDIELLIVDFGWRQLCPTRPFDFDFHGCSHSKEPEWIKSLV